jgi:hypothetical protein
MFIAVFIVLRRLSCSLLRKVRVAVSTRFPFYLLVMIELKGVAAPASFVSCLYVSIICALHPLVVTVVTITTDTSLRSVHAYLRSTELIVIIFVLPFVHGHRPEQQCGSQGVETDASTQQEGPPQAVLGQEVGDEGRVDDGAHPHSALGDRGRQGTTAAEVKADENRSRHVQHGHRQTWEQKSKSNLFINVPIIIIRTMPLGFCFQTKAKCKSPQTP